MPAVPRVLAVALAGALLAASGCSDDARPDGSTAPATDSSPSESGHGHTHAGEADLPPAGDGTYPGTSAHLTGFHVESGSAVHMHPLGSPATTEGSAELRFHTSLPEPGHYVLFLQVPVDGFLHTLPVTVTAT